MGADDVVAVRSAEWDVEDDVGVSSKRGAEGADDEGADDRGALDVVVEVARRGGRAAGLRWTVCNGAAIVSSVTLWMITVDGAEGRQVWRNGNWDSSKTTCLDVMTRLDAMS